MRKRVQNPDESPDECQKRIRAECKRDWQNDELRALYSSRAKRLNRFQASSDAISAHVSGLAEVIPQEDGGEGDVPAAIVPQPTCRQYIPCHAPGGGYGCFGIGDLEYSLRVKDVQDLDESCEGFVRKWAAKWRNHAGGICNEDKSLLQLRASVRLSCLDEFGFCVREIASMPVYKTVQEQLLGFVRHHHRRHLSGAGKKTTNNGPSVDLPHLLLVAFDVRDQQQLVVSYVSKTELFFFLGSWLGMGSLSFA